MAGTAFRLSRRELCALAGAAGVTCALAGVARAEEPASSLDDFKWWQKTAVYEVYPKSFQDTVGAGTGTIPGITEHLDYLASLGVGALWLTPIYKSPMVDNGYDVADYLSVDPSYGTMDDMRALIDETDRRGIKIVMDLVFNHTSDQCPWFVDSRSSRDADKADWYVWRDAREDGSAPTNWRSIFGGSAWEWCEERQQYYLHTFAPQQPDLNWENPDVRQALYDVANTWLDLGVGGFRIDAVTYIKKPAVFEDGPVDAADGMSRVHDATANTPGILDFLHEFKENVCVGHDIFTVGEANGVEPADLPDWVGDDGVFDMVFSFDHMHVPMGAAEQWCYPADWTLTDLKRAFAASQEKTAHNGWYPVFFENHDQPRSVSNFFPEGTDTVEAAKALGAVLMTMRGTPFIYQGEELGYANVAWPSIDDYNDVSSKSQYEFALEEGFTEEEALAVVHRFSRDNARTPMQWDASDNAGFTTGTPWLPVHDDYADCNADVQQTDDGSVLSWYRKLAELRAEHPELVAGDYEELFADSEQVFAFARVAGDAKCVTLANFSSEPASYDVDALEALGLSEGDVVLASQEGPAFGELRPLEAVVYAAGSM